MYIYIYIYIYVYSETQKAVKINDTDTNVRPKTIHFLLSIFCQSTHDTFEIVYQTIGIHLCHVSQWIFDYACKFRLANRRAM
jgi:hypothetical protein